MNSRPDCTRTQLYGTFAFAAVIVACYGQFLLLRRLDAEPWQVVASFALGALYIAFAILANHWAESDRPRARFGYFAILCAILTALMAVTPILRSFFGIIVLPAVSQAIFDLKRKGAVAVVLYLFALSIGTIGPGAIGEAVISYGAAYAFTIVFTVITAQAIRAREAADNLRRELEVANTQLRAQAAQAAELATTRERNRLAREIHDGVGHYLTTIKVQLDAASALLPAAPARAADTVAKAGRLAAEALDDVRRSVGALAADAARPPLVETLRQLAAHGAPATAVHVEGTPRPLPPAAEHALFRSAQEGLTNLRKHAAATAATLTLDFRAPQRVRLTLVDNGRGAPAAPARPHASGGGGYGLRGLQERVALLGGSVTSGNVPHGGFSLAVDLPA